MLGKLLTDFQTKNRYVYKRLYFDLGLDFKTEFNLKKNHHPNICF